jgi:hypothetical protein
VAGHVRHEPVPLGVVHDVADEGARLAPVVVGPERVGGADHVAVDLPGVVPPDQ